MKRNPLRAAGLVATATSLAALWLVSQLDHTIPFAPTALAGRIIRLLPGDLATFFIELLQHWAMRLFTLGVLVASVALGAQMMVWTAGPRGPRPGLAGVLLAAFAALASMLDPSTDPNVAGVIVVSIGAAALYAAVAGSSYRNVTSPEIPQDMARRRALRLAIGTGAGVVVAGGAISWLGKRLSGPNTDVDLVAPVERATLPTRSNFPDIPGLTPEITSPDDHYVVDINLVQPSVEAEGWSLTVSGLVDSPLEVTFAELQERFEVVEEYAVLSCVSNEVGGDLVGHSLWGGIRLRDVLTEAGVGANAADVVFRAADGYSDSITLETALDPSVLLAVSQNRKPLQREHGFPCRVRIPSIYGMKNVKWLESIELVASDYTGYWQKRGWSDVATVRTQSRIDVPEDGARVSIGNNAWIAGIAWAGDRGISKVEVSLDDGQTWAEAMLRDPIGPYSWTQWAYDWIPSSEDGSITCRATDGRGNVQTSDRADPHPAGATGWHSIGISVT